MESLDGFNVSPKPDLGYSRVTEKKDIILSSVFLCGVFFITMNDIFDSATAFNNLTQIEYEFKLGRKNKIITLNVNFQKYQFHHLAV